jgi:hypothetical protein
MPLRKGVTLKLTVPEANWLMAQLDVLETRAIREGVWPLARPGSGGRKIMTTFPSWIVEKLSTAVVHAKTRGERR